jgi:hypothetical protein
MVVANSVAFSTNLAKIKLTNDQLKARIHKVKAQLGYWSFLYFLGLYFFNKKKM